MSETAKATHCYVSRCRECQGWRSVIVDEPLEAAEVANEIARAARKGLQVDRVELGEFRSTSAATTCKCIRRTEREPRQLTLAI